MGPEENGVTWTKANVRMQSFLMGCTPPPTRASLRPLPVSAADSLILWVKGNPVGSFAILQKMQIVLTEDHIMGR